MRKNSLILGIGIDAVDIAVVKRARFKQRLSEYFLTEEEIARMPIGPKSIEFLASRFAVKEAVIKAFPEKLSPFDFCVESSGSSSPTISFFHPKNQNYSVLISMTHTPKTATAIAIVSTP